MAEVDNAELELRQWLFEHLTDRRGGRGAVPPRPLVHALAGIAQSTPFDLGWATLDYDHRTEVTTWTGLVANATVLAEFQATAQLADASMWTGNSTRPTTAYSQEPVIEVGLLRHEDVCSAHLSTRGAGDAFEYDQRLRQSWTFSFADGTTRTYTTDANDGALLTDRELLCRRLVLHL